MGRQSLKNLHSNQIVKLIKTAGPISRIEISEKINIPQPTITRITEELLKMNIIKENGLGPSNGGRRPVLLDFNENCYYSIGLEIGRTNMKLALTNLNGKILAFQHSTYDNVQDIVQFAQNSVNEMMKSTNIDVTRLLGMGVGMPGPLFLDDNQVLKSPNFLNGETTNLPEKLHDTFDFPIQFDKDANVAALAEKWFGEGIGTSNFIYVMADEGIGCGIVLRDQLYRGVHGEAGGLGHTIVNLFGEKCTCGNYGCLETLVSKQSILEKVKAQLKAAPPDAKTEFHEDDFNNITVESISRAAAEGSSVSQQVLKESGMYLGVGLSNIVSFYDPELIILGGTVGTSHRILKDSISDAINQRVLGVYGKKIKVSLSNTEESIVLGAAALVIDNIFKLFSNHIQLYDRDQKDAISSSEMEDHLEL